MRKILLFVLMLLSMNIIHAEEQGIRQALSVDIGPLIRYLGTKTLGAGLSYELTFNYLISTELTVNYTYNWDYSYHNLSPMLMLKFYFAGTGPTQSYVMIGVEDFNMFVMNDNNTLNQYNNIIAPSIGAGYKWVPKGTSGFFIEPYGLFQFLIDTKASSTVTAFIGAKFGLLF